MIEAVCQHEHARPFERGGEKVGLRCPECKAWKRNGDDGWWPAEEPLPSITRTPPAKKAAEEPASDDRSVVALGRIFKENPGVRNLMRDLLGGLDACTISLTEVARFGVAVQGLALLPLGDHVMMTAMFDALETVEKADGRAGELNKEPE